ncbi:Dephospho-CoA kinase [subsurface metagenome]
MKVIGLTGGIGSGKSTVAQFLAELGAVIVDLDKVGHEVLKSGGARTGADSQ